MSAPVRFLALVMIGWTAVRAATLGVIPGFTVSYAKAPPLRDVPPIVATNFPPIPPVVPVAAAADAGWPSAPPPAVYYAAYPYSYPVQAAASNEAIPPRPAWHLAPAQSAASGLAVASDAIDWQISKLPSLRQGQSRPIPVVPIQPRIDRPLDRLQVTSWALLRGQTVPGSLASGGTLGGSQAGSRLTYNINRWLAASARVSTPLGASRGMEVAAGLRFAPLRSIPVAITVERRQAVGHGGGRSAFALFAEGGLYRQPMPWKFSLDGYFQAGVVGVKSRDLFADGAISLTRPLMGRFSAGFGLWGGIQPGLYRIDAGPRISFRLRHNLYAHVDWRQRIAGTARPASGPALTLAADF